MEKIYYSNEKNVQILIGLLKAHNIRKVVANPGTCNICFVGSIQNDDFFEIYSCVDERSACYMACGLAEESGEPVVLSCTGATSSRNYIPGLTEAFYRKLPILVVTSTIHQGNIGNNIPQSIDRSIQLKDMIKLSVQIPSIKSVDDQWQCEVSMNRAILELNRDGGGPAHINLVNEHGNSFDVVNLPPVRKIERIISSSAFPNLTGKIGIFIGSHKKMSNELTNEIDLFCEYNNAVVLCDYTSNYIGKYGIKGNLICNQESYSSPLNDFDLIIHLGNTSGAYMKFHTKEVWRVCPDGEIRDTFRKLKYVFDMEELVFFEKYNSIAKREKKNIEFYQKWNEEFKQLQEKTENIELPFSNIWIANNTIKKLPDNCTVHLAILSTLRSWNFFDYNKKIFGFTNTGGFGIDGMISTLIGASLANPEKIFYGVVGDLAFFYDMNVLGNRNIKSNVRLMLINNCGGAEFHLHINPGYQISDVGKYISADNHNGKKSINLVKHYAEDLGFEYISATNKKEFINNIEYFVANKKYKKPIIFEVFTDMNSEVEALQKITNLKSSVSGKAKKAIKDKIGSKTKTAIKKIINQKYV